MVITYLFDLEKGSLHLLIGALPFRESFSERRTYRYYIIKLQKHANSSYYFVNVSQIILIKFLREINMEWLIKR